MMTLMDNDAVKSVAISSFSLWHQTSGIRPPCTLVIRPWNEGKDTDLSCKTSLRFTAGKHQVQIRQNI